MIKIDGTIIDVGSFPDGSMLVKYDHHSESVFEDSAAITWIYENDREFIALIYLVKHLRENDVRDIFLNMPYIPNARQDRVKNDDDVFTLKYFSELLNSLNLNRVEVLDPHSNVSAALINNLVINTPENYIVTAITKSLGGLVNWSTDRDRLIMFYPDEGAMKRYSSLIKLPYAFGIKKRNWETGVIEGLDVAGAVDQIIGRDILIVDDICSRGGTFYHSAKKLKELGAKDIYLYVSHCENTILEGDLLKGDLIKKVYTTDSIFTKIHEKVEVLK